MTNRTEQSASRAARRVVARCPGADDVTTIPQSASLNLIPSFSLYINRLLAGYSESVAVVGGKVAIPCNATIWGEELISLVLWQRDVAGVGLPIYTVDARSTSLSKSKHSVPPEYKDRLYFDVTLKPPILRIVSFLT